MERRKEPRVEINQNVTITLLGEPESSPFRATALDMSGGGMRILSPRQVAYQAAVKVQAGDLLLLGEVVRVQEGEGGYTLALKLQHSLDMAGDLHRLSVAIQMEDTKDSRGKPEKVSA
jgi:hypothetical protein